MSSSTLTPSDSQRPPKISKQPGIRRSQPRLGLRGRLTLMAIALAVAPVLSVGGLLYWLSGQAIARQSAQEQIIQTQLAAAAVQDVLKSRYQSTAAVSAIPLFTDPNLRQSTTLDQQQQTLNAFLQRLDGVESIALLDNRGQLIVQANSDQPLESNLGQQPIVQNALAAKQISMSPLTVAEAEVEELDIDFAAPVIDDVSEEVVGIIYLRAPGRILQFALDSLSTEAPNWFLLNANAQIVGSSDPNRVGQLVTSQWAQVADQIASQKPISSTGKEANGRRVSLSYAPLPLSDELPQQTLGVLLSSDTASTLAPSRPLLAIVLGGTGVAAILAALAAVASAQTLTQPIQQAIAAIRQLERGNFRVNLQPQGAGELDEIGNGLNTLGRQLDRQLNTVRQEHASEQQQRQQRWDREQERLQADVLQIKQVLVAMAAGNWSVEAAVNDDLPTAPVAAAVNQMIQVLGETLNTLGEHTEQLGQQIQTLRTGTATTVENTQQQQQTVMEVQTAVTEVKTQSDTLQQQAIATGETLDKTQQILAESGQELTTLVDGLDALQQGTTQIVQRPQTLAEFVDLAAQFSKEQKRVAAQTRVLALNASMLASRATSQQDPSQFASVAHEFETIAQQINDLAVEANQNLILLKQRSDQIQTVISGLDQDVQNMNEMVGGVTTGVDQFHKLFESLSAVSAQTQATVQQITLSSQGVATAAQTATHTTQALETASTTIQDQARLTQQEAAQTDVVVAALQQQLRLLQPASDDD